MMRLFRRIAAAATAGLRRDRVESELDEELRDYLEASVEAKVGAGLTRDDAIRSARAEFGSPAAVKDWVRDVGWESRIESIWQDLRYAFRLLRRSPVFTASAVLTLALGIGATTAIFTIVEAVVLRPLAIAEPGRVVSLERSERDTTMRKFMYPTYLRLREEGASIFESVAASGNSGLRVRVGSGAVQVGAAFVTEDYFAALGLSPSQGRFFAPQEHSAGAPAVAVVTDAFWRTRMGADPNVIGQAIRIADTYASVVGVAPRGFRGLELGAPVELFMPVMAAALVLPPANYLSDTPAMVNGLQYSPQSWVDITARLKPGVTAAAAQTFLSTSTFGRARRPDGSATSMRFVPTSSIALSPLTRAETKRFTTLLAIVVSLVLLIGCANLAGLILARNEQRRRETAVRLALGARTARVVRLFLAESLLLSILGGAAGLLVAGWMLQLMGAFVIPGPIRLETLQLGLTQRVLLFAAAAALFTAMVSGLLPALFGSRVDLTSALKTRPGATTRGRSLARGALVSGQVAISLMLIVGAVLFVRSLRSALTTEVGTDADRIGYATVSFWRAGYDEARLARFTQTIVERMSGLPGIERVTFGALQLAETPGSVVRLRIDGVERQLPRTFMFPCGPDYFTTIGIPIVVGRALGPDDGKAGAPPALVVNEAFGQQAWPGVSPLGRRVILYPAGPEFEVVGVARNGKYANLSEEGRLAVYLPWHADRRSPDGARVTFVVRSAANTPTVLSLQQQIRQADPGLPIFAAGTIDDRIAALAMPQRIGASLLGWFSVLAFALAVLGIYGLVAYAVARRTSEIGIHIALGAEPADVVRGVMRRSLVPVVAGIIAGLGGAYALTRLATSFLFGIAPHDALSYAGATTFLIVSAALASYVPARRAARIDPLIALRAE